MAYQTFRSLGKLSIVLLPLVLILVALFAAGTIAFGTHPHLMTFSNGLGMILLTRRLQWPLVALVLVMCLVLVGLVVTNRRRAWWLLALAPVLALFYYRFSTGAMNAFAVIENPPTVKAAEAAFLADGDYVVGLRFADTAYAYPYAALYLNPVIIQRNHEKRMILLWSAFANRATAFHIDREIKPRELEVVSMPANALLVYDARVGQFINGVTGRTPADQPPGGFHSSISVDKVTWKQWRTAHPETLVMSLARSVPGMNAPARPYYPMPRVSADLPADTRIAVIPTTQPCAIESTAVGSAPVNINCGKLPVLLVRDPATGLLRAYDRRLDDLSPQFRLNRDPRHPKAAYLDSDTRLGWSAQMMVVEEDRNWTGPRHLQPVPIEDDLYWGVMKFWYPLELKKAPPPPAEPPPLPTPPVRPPRRGP